MTEIDLKIKELQSLVKLRYSEISEIEKKLRRLIIERILECEHNDLISGDYIKSDHNPIPPFRVCKECGLTEQSWDCGNQILGKYRYDVVTVSRKEAFKYSLTQNVKNSDLVVTHYDRTNGISIDDKLKKILEYDKKD